MAALTVTGEFEYRAETITDNKDKSTSVHISTAHIPLNMFNRPGKTTHELATFSWSFSSSAVVVAAMSFDSD